MSSRSTRLAGLLRTHEADLLDQWVTLQRQTTISRPDLIAERELRDQSARFLKAIQEAVEQDETDDITRGAWEPVRETLAAVSDQRARQGFSPSETATFVFSLKQPLVTLLAAEKLSGQELLDEVCSMNLLLDKLGLFTTEVYQKRRNEIITRQQQEMLELSTPVVELWDGILALPLIGTLDSNRTQVVMESLLQRIVETGAGIAILDITGVPTVDTLVAQHLIKTVSAARLMGADCIISGIRPQIAQTIVHLGVDLAGIVTKATLAGAFDVADRRWYLSRARNAEAEDARLAARRGERTGSPASFGDRPGCEEQERVERIPILKMGDLLLVTIQVDMHDRLAMTLQDDLTAAIVAQRARGVLIDISSLEVVDSFIGRMLANIAAMARVLDAETVVVGMRPAVAITLVELGVSLSGVRTALNVERGMDQLRAALATGKP
jgi:rsbT co-antagonist protein RsbR